MKIQWSVTQLEQNNCQSMERVFPISKCVRGMRYMSETGNYFSKVWATPVAILPKIIKLLT
jgi:hypothetical protein